MIFQPERTNGNTLYIVDGYGYIFRAYFATERANLRAPNGQAIGAVYGFFRMLISLINSEKPTHLVVAMDTGHRTFRNDLYDQFLEQKGLKEFFTAGKPHFDAVGLTFEDILNLTATDLIERLEVPVDSCIAMCEQFGVSIENMPKLFVLAIFLHIENQITVESFKTQYKATRRKTPDDLISQFAIIHELIDACGIKKMSSNGFEADDVIASIATQTADAGHKVCVVSADKDLCQLVCDGKISVFDPARKVFLDEAGVQNKFGVPAKNVFDYLCIIGDHCDNVPGINGIGPKGAVDLINKYGSLDGIFQHAGELSKHLQGKLEASKEHIELTKQLIRLRTDAVKDIDFDSFRLNLDNQHLHEFAVKYGFSALNKISSADYKKKKEEDNNSGNATLFG